MIDPLGIAYGAGVASYAAVGARVYRGKLRADKAAKDRGEWCGKWGCRETDEHQHGAQTYLSPQQFKGQS